MRKITKRCPLNLRTTIELRTKIEDAALRTGRSLTQEVEMLLELGLLFRQLIEKNLLQAPCVERRHRLRAHSTISKSMSEAA